MYGVVEKAFAGYFNGNTGSLGNFSWFTDGTNGGLTDPDGFRNKTAGEILAILFGEVGS